jgi:hypothetical protein
MKIENGTRILEKGDDVSGEAGELIQKIWDQEIKCWSCSESSYIGTQSEVRAYKHSSGIKGRIGGERDRWWVFFVCKNCNYQNSHEVIRRIME